MQFITRQLYEENQSVSSSASRRWKKACEDYQIVLKKTILKLPAGMKSFAEVTLHDGKIMSAIQPETDRVILQIDSRQNPWGPMGLFSLEFTGVCEVDGLARIPGDIWLYEEVHLNSDEGFEYSVLLWKSEFRIVAREVCFKPLKIQGKKK